MFLSVLFLPFISTILCGLFGRSLGVRGSQIISTFLIFLTFLISTYIFYDVGINLTPCYISLFQWFSSGLLYISWGFTFDAITSVMLIVVTFVSFLVHLYSIGYMAEDPHVPRFMCYLSLFTFFMLILILADNFIQLFVGWEGVGVVSYLLISFWYTRIQANKAAMMAIFVNRIGDFGLSISLFAIFYTFKSLDFDSVFSLVPYVVGDNFSILGFQFDKLTFICIFLFIGAIGKSAQLGLHIWLPFAMEAATPVSALIHAATMVTAGVFLVIRCSPIFEFAPFALLIVTILGALTAFFAASTGLFQNDLKKVIAYSTCSQLGYMTFVCGLSHYSISLFHLMNHAFFKALLFLSAGSVIHALGDEQDMRKMGGLIRLIPLTYCFILIGSFSLMGLPFLSGFYSKDIILEIAYSHLGFGQFAYWLGTLTAFITAYYSIRLLILTFLSTTNSSYSRIKNIHESPIIMLIPLFILSFGSIFSGYLTKDLMIGLGTNFWNQSIYQKENNILIIDAEFLPSFVKLLPVIGSILGFILAMFLHYYFISLFVLLKLKAKTLYSFFNQRWYIEKVYNEYITQSFLDLGYNITFKMIDRGILEILGPYGLVKVISRLSHKISELHTGLIYHYALLIILGLTFFVGCLWIDKINDIMIIGMGTGLMVLILSDIYKFKKINNIS